MRAILERIKKEDGAGMIIEMTLIFPLVVLVLGFLIYLGSYVMQGVSIYNDAQRIAVLASREAGLPGYDYFYEDAGVTTKADFNWAEGSAPSISLVNLFMNEHDPYRYWTSNMLDESEKGTLESMLEQLVSKNSFLSSTTVDCTITTSNYVLSQQVQVRIVKYINPPKFIQALGLASDVNIDVTATAVVGDPAEFVRNTDLVFDLADYVLNDMKIGSKNQSIGERIAIYEQKFNDLCAKIGIDW